MKRELIDILVDLASIVEGLSDDPDFSGGWQIGGIVKELEAIQSVQTANEVISPTGYAEASKHRKIHVKSDCFSGCLEK